MHKEEFFVTAHRAPGAASSTRGLVSVATRAMRRFQMGFELKRRRAADDDASHQHMMPLGKMVRSGSKPSRDERPLPG
jgi:hypothetical protein